MVNKKNTLKIIFITTFFLVLSPFTVSAVTYGGGTGGNESGDDYTLLQPLPGLGEVGEEGQSTDLGSYLGNLFTLGLGIAGVLAVIMIMIGGVLYMTAEAASVKNTAKTTITNAILGLVLALSSWLLLHTINPGLVSSSLSLEPVEPPTTHTPPEDKTFEGSCKTPSGSVFTCNGTTKTECIDSCTMHCSAIPDIETPCAETGGVSVPWIGVCGTPQGKECGGSTKKKCETNCKTTCTEAIHWWVPCQRTIN